MREDTQKLEFEQLLSKHSGILYKVANTYCRQLVDRPDLIQEMIIQIWRSLPSYDGRASYATWMYRIAINVAISFYRKKKRHYEHLVPLESLDLDLIALDEIDANVSEDIAILNRLIKELDELSRALLLLYLDGYDHKEIASVLGISASNVATKIARLKQTLQNKFSTLDS